MTNLRLSPVTCKDVQRGQLVLAPRVRHPHQQQSKRIDIARTLITIEPRLTPPRRRSVGGKATDKQFLPVNLANVPVVLPIKVREVSRSPFRDRIRAPPNLFGWEGWWGTFDFFKKIGVGWSQDPGCCGQEVGRTLPPLPPFGFIRVRTGSVEISGRGSASVDHRGRSASDNGRA